MDNTKILDNTLDDSLDLDYMYSKHGFSQTYINSIILQLLPLSRTTVPDLLRV